MAAIHGQEYNTSPKRHCDKNAMLIVEVGIDRLGMVCQHIMESTIILQSPGMSSADLKSCVTYILMSKTHHKFLKDRG